MSLQKKLYIDIDGVLLGKNLETHEYCLANQVKDFMIFALANFDCYWLTTHCKGDASVALDYLTPYCHDDELSLFRLIKTTNYKTFKTEALSGDFIWIDDQPTAYELQVLEENDWFDRWFEINTRKNLDELIKLIPALEARLAEFGDSYSRHINPMHTKHFPEGVVLESRQINQDLPFLEFSNEGQLAFRLQRENTCLVVEILDQTLSLKEIVERFHSWLNKSPYNNGPWVFDKLFRLNIEKASDGVWSKRRFGAIGSIEYISRTISSGEFDTDELKDSPETTNDKWIEGEVDITQPFYYFHTGRLEIAHDIRAAHIANLQVNARGQIVVQFSPWSDWQRDQFLEDLNKLAKLESELSLIERIHLWGKFVNAQRAAHRDNEYLYCEPPWSSDYADPFTIDHSAYHDAVIHPILMNGIGDEVISNHTVDETAQHIRIERYALNGRNKTRLIGLLSILSDGPFHLVLFDDWKELSNEQRYKITSCLIEDIFNRFEYPDPQLNLLKRCYSTNVIRYRDQRKPKPEISFSYYSDGNKQIEMDDLSALIREKRNTLLEQLEA